MPTTPLLQPAGVRFDPVKLLWLGSKQPGDPDHLCVAHRPGPELEDLRHHPAGRGRQAPGTTQYDFPVR